MKCIPVSPGYEALVDDEVYPELAKYSWSMNRSYPARGYHQDRRLKCVRMHQAVFGPIPQGYEIDHINGNRLDCRKENLRMVSHQKNCFNRAKIARTCKSKYKGVTWSSTSQKWHARIGFNGKRYSLGYFSSEIDAALAYNAAAEKFFGNYARLNQV